MPTGNASTAGLSSFWSIPWLAVQSHQSTFAWPTTPLPTLQYVKLAWLDIFSKEASVSRLFPIAWSSTQTTQNYVSSVVTDTLWQQSTGHHFALRQWHQSATVFSSTYKVHAWFASPGTTWRAAAVPLPTWPTARHITQTPTTVALACWTTYWTHQQTLAHRTETPIVRRSWSTPISVWHAKQDTLLATWAFVVSTSQWPIVAHMTKIIPIVLRVVLVTTWQMTAGALPNPFQTAQLICQT